MEDFKTPVPIEWKNQRVLLTSQLAEAYDCSTRQIKQNFNNNKEQYIEGLHYFYLAGETLRTFKRGVENFDLVPPNTNALYLWTERGAVRHCKSINTSEAWKVFDVLEKNYFNPASMPVTTPAPVHVPNPNRVAGQLTPASVYAALMNDGTIKIVKIGQSNNVEDRLAEVSSPSKLTVERYYKTSPMPRKIARLVEKACHNIFSSFRVSGEIFSVDFDTACKVLISLEKFVAALPSTADCEKLLKATNLIVGKNAD